MTTATYVVLALVEILLVDGIVLNIRTRRTPDPDAAVAEFRAACDELERVIGESLRPSLERLVEALERFSRP